MSMDSSRWSIRPLHVKIYDIVSERKTIRYSELIRMLRSIDASITDDEVNKELMKLEIWGKIDVITEGAGKLIVLRG